MDNTFTLDNILNFDTEFDNSGENIKPSEIDSSVDDETDDTEITTDDETEPDADEPDEEDKDLEDDKNPVKVYYQFLTESSLLEPNEDFKFDGTVESLKEAEKQTLQNRNANAYKALWTSLPDEFKGLLEYASNGGTDLKSFWKETTVDDYDLDREEDQIQVLKDYYKETTKFSQERINKLIKTFKDSEELEQEAEDALKTLKTLKEEKKVESLKSLQLQKQQAEEKDAQFRESIAKTLDSLDYIPKERKGKVKAFMFNVITKQDGTLTDYQRTWKSITSNPEHLSQLADLLLDYSKDNGLSYERFKNKGKTEATQDFKKRLEQASSDLKPKQTSKKGSNTSSTFDWRAFLEL